MGRQAGILAGFPWINHSGRYRKRAIRRNTLKNPFLAYANCPLKGKPKNLHKIFDSIERHYSIAASSRTYIRDMIDRIVELSDYDDPGIVAKYRAVPAMENANSGKESGQDLEFDEKDIREAMKILGMPREEAIKRLKGSKPVEPESLPENQIIIPKQVPNPDIEITRRIEIETEIETINNIATEAVYGYRDGFCENKCTLRDLITKELGQNVFSGPERPKCYECYQTYFVYMLSMVTERRPYSQEFLFFLNNSSKYIKRVLQPIFAIDIDKREDATEHLEEVVYFIVDDPLFYGAIKRGPSEIYKGAFHNFLYALIAGILAEFLTEEGKNRVKLKKCFECGDFFIGRPNKRYCSKMCWKRKCQRIYMRKKRDPKSPRYDQRYKLREFG